MIESCKPITKLNQFYYPKRIIFFDTEAFTNNKTDKEEKHKFRLGVLIYIELDNNTKETFRQVYYFDTIKKFFDYVSRKTRPDIKLYIFAHNMKYDLMCVNGIKELEQRLYDLPIPVINNAFILSAKKSKKQIKFVDTFNYVKTSVEELGKAVGIPKLSVDFDNVQDDELYKYCENDVLIITEFMLKFIHFLHDNKLGSLKDTTASTAFDIYRHKFITTPIYYHKNDDILNLERSAYRGGMVECYRLFDLPKGKYYLLDVNSMYPYVMSNCKLPNYPILSSQSNNLNDLIEHVNKHYVIADVLIKVKHNSIRRYGLKFNRNDKKLKTKNNTLIFPIGTFRITLHNEELKEVIKNDEILEVYQYVVYNSEKSLKKYADYFYEQKKNATNKADYTIAKLLMNSLYGRFGMRKYISDVLDFSNIPDMFDFSPDYFMDVTPDKIKSIYYKWGNIFIHSYAVEDEHVKNTNIALAGSVTAYARMLLTKYIEIAQSENVYYMDTDSLVINEIGYNNLLQYIDEKELGYLKVEMIFNSGHINAPKHYTFIEKRQLKIKSIRQYQKIILPKFKQSIIVNKRIRSKGIPLNALNENGEYSFWRFTTIKDFMRSSGERFGRIKITKKNSYKYNKGNFDNSGNVSPYILEYDKCEQQNVIQKEQQTEK